MPIVVEQTVQAIAAVVQTVPIGTNIALMRLMWVMLDEPWCGVWCAGEQGAECAGSAAELGGNGTWGMGEQ